MQISILHRPLANPPCTDFAPARRTASSGNSNSRISKKIGNPTAFVAISLCPGRPSSPNGSPFSAAAAAFAAKIGLAGGVGDGFSVGLWVCLRKAGNDWASTPSHAAFPGRPLAVLVFRRGLGVGIDSGTCLGIDGILPCVFVPLRRSLRCGFHRPVGCRHRRHGLGRQSGDGWAQW